MKSSPHIPAADARDIIRRVLCNPDPALYSYLAPELTNSGRVNDAPEMIQRIWTTTKGFQKQQTAALRKKLSSTEAPDKVTSLMIDDYALSIAENIDPAFHALLMSDVNIPTRLPLADYVLGRHKKSPRFARTILLACQHLMGTTVTQLAYLNKFGIPWEDMYVIGKPYSTSRAALLTLVERGVHVSDFSLYFPRSTSAGWYEAAMSEAIEQMITNIGDRLSPRDRVLVLDDGGMVIQVLAEKHGLEAGKVVAVEQTTGGRVRIQQTEPDFPVINVAGADAKLSQEAKSIAMSIVDELRARLVRIRDRDTLRDERILIIGYGAVGAWLATVLRESGVVDIRVFDSDNRMTAIAVANGYQGVFNLGDALPEASLIVGCTGTRAIPQHADQRIAEDAILVSASSNNVEFNGLVSKGKRAQSRLTYQVIHPFETIAKVSFTRLHDDYHAQVRGRQFWVTNAGFPVNFTGALDPIPAHSIQITRTLMLAGALDAFQSSGTGLRRLRAEYDNCIREAFAKMRQT